MSAMSPRVDPELGTSPRATRRKRPARQSSEAAVPDSPPRGPPNTFGSPWFKFSSRRVRLGLVIVCVCLAGMLRSAWLPVLASRFARPSSYSPAEANRVQADRGVPVANDMGSTTALTRQSSGSSGQDEHGTTDTRRFLTFLPHSGFNNQRIALENAMLLAYILNCTLIAPPVRLGEPLPYRPFDTLLKWNEYSSRPRPEPCARYPHLAQCAGVNAYVQMPWNTLVDFTTVRKELGLDMIFMRGSQTPIQFLRQMGFPEQSIAFLKDEVMYQFLIHDSHGHVGSGSRYVDEWSLDYLRDELEPSTAIHFGTLFGTGRVKIRNPVYAAARRQIHDSMVISHLGVLDTANVIRQKIIGASPDNASYVAAHVRVTGRKFRGSAKANGRLAWWELITWLGLDPKNGTDLERQYLRAHGRYARPPTPPNLAAFETSTRSLSAGPHAISSGNPSCMRRSGPLDIPLFIATDAPNPRAHPALGLFFATFPCAYVLDDFRTDLNLLDAFRDVDGLPMRRFLVPLVDMVVAGQATRVVGTINSTFSDYITRTLHPAYSRGT